MLFLTLLIFTEVSSLQVAHEPVPFVLLDMREDKSSKLKHKSVRIRDAVQLSEALVDATKWRSITKGTEPFPSQGHLLIFVHDRKVCLVHTRCQVYDGYRHGE